MSDTRMSVQERFEDMDDVHSTHRRDRLVRSRIRSRGERQTRPIHHRTTKPMTTVYTIKNNGIEYQTDDIDEVKEMKKQDAAVKAQHHVETVKQTEDDKGVLVMSDEPDWVESDPVIMADANAWVFTEGWE